MEDNPIKNFVAGIFALMFGLILIGPFVEWFVPLLFQFLGTLLFWFIHGLAITATAFLPAYGAYQLGSQHLNAIIKDPNRLSNLVTLDFYDSSLSSEINSAAISEHTARYSAFMALSSIILSLFFLALLTRLYTIPSDALDYFLLYLCTALSTFFGLGFLFGTCDLQKQASQRISHAVTTINTQATHDPRLTHAVTSNALIAQQLGVDFAQHEFLNIKQYISENKSYLVADPERILPVLEQQRAQANADNQELQHAKTLFDTLLETHSETLHLATKINSPSVLSQLDDILTQAYQARDQYIPLREWRQFEKVTSILISDLRELHQLTQGTHHYADSPEPDAVSFEPGKISRDAAYILLGVSPEDSLSVIRHVYHKLAHIYHSDKNTSTQRSDRMKQLNEAMNIIENEKKT